MNSQNEGNDAGQHAGQGAPRAAQPEGSQEPVTPQGVIGTVEVRGSGGYPVVVGRGIGEQVLAHVPERAEQLAIIAPEALMVTAEAVQEAINALGGPRVSVLAVPDGEDAKSLQVASFCWDTLGSQSFTRSDAVVGLGGGAVTDLAGFVAATWLRGIDIVQVPTTLLGMVDAAVGGKTGINVDVGKNLVGSFHRPVAVICDLDTLQTLPQMDLTAGMAEVVKAGMIEDATILDLIESDPEGAVDWASPTLAELVVRSIQVKADVVSEDFGETVGLSAAGAGGVPNAEGRRWGGLGREVLNYGHTFAHAIERAERYKWRHGAAVAVGMTYAAELGRLAGRTPDHVVDRQRGVLELLGLPTTYSNGKWDVLLRAMQVDKKAQGSLLRFVVLEGIGRPAILAGPDPALLVAAYDEVRS